MYRINYLQKSFKRKVVLDIESLTLEEKVYGLLGPNGAGKTTFMRCLTQNYPIKRDTVFKDGYDVLGDKAYIESIGYLPQSFGLFKDLKLYDGMAMLYNLRFGELGNAEEEILRALEQVNLSEKMNDKIGSLSGGMLRRAGIAQAIVGNPALLIFDEPTSGLDPIERKRFKSLINEIRGDKTIIISTHIVEDLENLCDEIIVLNLGRIVAKGTADELCRMAGMNTLEDACEYLLNMQNG